MEFLLAHERGLRAAVFFGLTALLVVSETLAPRRRRELPRLGRSFANVALVVLGTLCVRLIAPLGALGAAWFAERRGLGLLRSVDLARWLEIVFALLVLDLALWAQHVASHRVPLFWRVHRVHHTDVDLDVTSGVRFHPLELLVSLGWKALVVVALGATPATVLVFELALNGMSLFNHANLRLPQRVEQILRTVLVTPDVHRVHHSVWRDETDSNYGFQLVLWDRLFGTFTAQPRDGHESMRLGLDAPRDPATVAHPGRLLWLPLRPLMVRDDDRSDSSSESVVDPAGE